jgi:beta-glucanase (GH16 family)
MARFLSYALAALLAPALCPAAPPEHSRWTLTFDDEFTETSLDRQKWDVESGAPTHILSSRWPENIQVSGGACRLLTRKESRGGKEWTTAHLWTRSFRQKYGYFEARFRYGAATGLNNAFWLMPRADGRQDAGIFGMAGYLKKFEIDINEGHAPREVSMNVHNWEGEHWARPAAWTSPDDLTADYHVYGLAWDEKKLTWYVDGIVRRVYLNDICHLEAAVILSTAVLQGAGVVTDELDGTSMDVDYVRVYRREGPNPAAPPEAAR